METVTFIDNPTPERGGDYNLDGSRYCRVCLRAPTFDSDLVRYKATAYQVDVDGNFVLASSGAPASTPETEHSVAKSGITAGTHTMDPGWVIYIPAPSENIDPSSLPPDWQSGSTFPASGNEGDKFYCTGDDVAYTWSIGEFERIRMAKAKELLNALGPVGGADVY